MTRSLRGAPPPVGPRPVVRVVAPCGTLRGHEQALHAGLARLERAGCRVRFDPARAADNDRGYLAGDDAVRSAELCAALTEPGVEAIWFARGGSGGARTVEAALEAARRAAPRIVVGFSDATTLLNALAGRLGWVTFHGPVVTSLGRPEQIAFDLEASLAILGGAPGPRPTPGVPAALRGRLFGGNLTVLSSLCGTPVAPRPRRGSVWLLEDVGEAPYRLDRAFQQLRAAGTLRGAAGLLLGDLGLPPEEVAGCVAALRADAAPLPVVTGAAAGHRGQMALLPIGAPVEIGPDGRVSHSPVTAR